MSPLITLAFFRDGILGTWEGSRVGLREGPYGPRHQNDGEDKFFHLIGIAPPNSSETLLKVHLSLRQKGWLDIRAKPFPRMNLSAIGGKADSDQLLLTNLDL
jgi:hypothetical protein